MEEDPENNVCLFVGVSSSRKHVTNEQKRNSRRLKTQILMGFIFESLHCLCRFRLDNRRIRANKVSRGPYGDSKQLHENKTGCISCFIHLSRPATCRGFGDTASVRPLDLLSQMVDVSPQHLL